MKAAVLVGPQKIEVKDVPHPKPGQGEVLVKVRAGAICGSDISVAVAWDPSNERVNAILPLTSCSLQKKKGGKQ